jgi:transcriptional regulator with XRE-family HTH domain
MDQKLKQDRSLGGNIRRLRLEKGWTQEQTAAQLQLLGINMSRDFYAHIENGSYNIRVSELAALREIFQCRYDDFFLGI